MEMSSTLASGLQCRPVSSRVYGARVDEGTGKFLQIKGVAFGPLENHGTKLRRRTRDVEEVSKQYIAVHVRQRTQYYLCIAVGVVCVSAVCFTRQAGDWRSGRKEHSSSNGSSSTRGNVSIMSSTDAGSAQCRSSNTSTVGAETRARTQHVLTRLV